VIGNLLVQLFPLFDPSMPNMFPSFLATSLLGQLSIIHFLLGIGQGDLLFGLLFALTHFQKLCCSMGCFPSYIFHSVVDDIHINTIFIILSAFEHFVFHLVFVRFVVQLCKCSAWLPFGLPFGFFPWCTIRLLSPFIVKGLTSFPQNSLREELIWGIRHWRQ